MILISCIQLLNTSPQGTTMTGCYVLLAIWSCGHCEEFNACNLSLGTAAAAAAAAVVSRTDSINTC